MPGRHSVWRSYEDESLSLQHAGVQRFGEDLNFIQHRVHEFTVLRISLNISKHEPGLALLDLPDRFLARQSCFLSAVQAGVGPNLTRVVDDMLLGQYPREFDQSRK